MTDTIIADNTANQTLIAVQFKLDAPDDEYLTPLLIDDGDAPMKLSKLSDEERKLLNEYEDEIDQAWGAFLRIGHLLYRIKIGKLYRETYNTFASYCEKELSISRVHGDRLLNAYKTQEILKREPTGSVSIPQTESALRAMGGLDDSEKKAVAKSLKESGISNPTAKDVEAAKVKIAPISKPKAPKQPKPESLTLALAGIDEAVNMVREKKPEKDIIASLIKAAEHIKSLLKQKGVA